MSDARADCGRLNAVQCRYEIAEVAVADDVSLDAHPGARAEAAWARVRHNAIEVFLGWCRVVFDSHPDLHSFGWRQCFQYCPHGVGTFVVTTDVPDINGLDGLELGGESTAEGKLQHQVAEVLKVFGELEMQWMFGEDVYITVRREGIIEIWNGE